MRMSACLGLGLALSALVPAAALAGGHGHVMRPTAPRVIHVAPRPVYAPPLRALYGPPRNYLRHARGYRGAETGYFGVPAVYQPAGEGGASQAQAAPSGDPRPRPVVVTNYGGAPPLWQGDAGYVAQPAIYDVGSVLRDHPLPGRRARVVK